MRIRRRGQCEPDGKATSRMIHLMAVAIAATVALTACGGSGGAGGNGGVGGGGGGGQSALQAEIDARFPFVANEPFDVTYACSVGNVPGLLRSRPDASGKDTPYYFDFHSAAAAASGTFAFDVNYELDDSSRSHLGFSGTYSYSGDAIHVEINTVVNMPFLPPGQQGIPITISETSTRIEPHLGVVGYFETQGSNPLACIAVGHHDNPPSEAVDTMNFTRVPHYECQPFTIANTQEQNTFEFAATEMPLPGQRNTPVAPTTWVHLPGSFFRQRDVGSIPLITRGSGLYRRTDTTFYADFGPTTFDDFAVLKGTLAPFDVQQFGNAQDPCAFSLR